MVSRLSSALVVVVASHLEAADLVAWERTCRAWRAVSGGRDDSLWRTAYERAGFIARHCSGVRGLAARTWRASCLAQLSLARAWASSTEEPRMDLIRPTKQKPRRPVPNTALRQGRGELGRIDRVLLALSQNFVVLAHGGGPLSCWAAGGTGRRNAPGGLVHIASWRPKWLGLLQVLAACPLPDDPDNALVAISGSGVVEVWRANPPTLVQTIQPPGFLRLSLDPPKLALTHEWVVAMANGQVQVCSVASGQCLVRCDHLLNKRPGQCVAVDPSCSRLWAVVPEDREWALGLAQLPSLDLMDVRSSSSSPVCLTSVAAIYDAALADAQPRLLLLSERGVHVVPIDGEPTLLVAGRPCDGGCKGQHRGVLAMRDAHLYAVYRTCSAAGAHLALYSGGSLVRTLHVAKRAPLRPLMVANDRFVCVVEDDGLRVFDFAQN